MQEVKHKSFPHYHLAELLVWLNSKEIKGNVISITQAKDNRYNIFYWSNVK